MEFIKQIDDNCIDVTGSTNGMLFFLKLKADIYRYLTEYSIGEDHTEYVKLSQKNYEKAMYMMKLWDLKKISEKKDIKITLLQLSLRLNYAIF